MTDEQTPEKTSGKKTPKAKKPADDGVAARMAELEARLSTVERMLKESLPPEARALSAVSLKAAIDRNPRVEVEVLQDFKIPGTGAKWRQGRLLRACDYPQLRGLAQRGLLLGIPKEQEERLRLLREEAAALDERADAELRASDAAASAARAEVHRARAADLARQAKRESQKADEAANADT